MAAGLDTVGWYARRARAMSPGEIADRASRTVAHRFDAATFHVARPLWRSRWEPRSADVLREPPLERPLGFLVPARASGVRQQLPEEVDRLLARAAAALEGRYRFFGYPEVVVADRNADVDPFTGRSWARRHAKRIDVRRPSAGDAKWIWELNRCQDVPMLAAAWLLTGDATYAAAAANRMRTWIDSHAPGRGIAWSSGFEAGIRAISLALAMDALRGSPELPRHEVERILVSLWQHARWIERDPSRGSSANNHRIGELAGLVTIGCLAPELADAERILAAGLTGLEREAGLQIRPDGTNVEQAFGYHVFVLDLLLAATAALDAVGRPLPAAIRDALDHSGDALWAQIANDEPEPTYGDSDDSRALVLDGDERRTGRGVAAAIAARLGHAKAARTAGRLDATAWWLFGEEGAARFGAVEPAPTAVTGTLPDAGLTILRGGRSRVAIDHGPHGYLGLAAHAHADALALDLSFGPHRLVVDPGVGSYARRPVREAFRATGFHATVVVDGRSSSTPGGPFLWTGHANAELLFADLAARAVLASHDGYRDLPDPVTHLRAVALLDDAAAVVVDRLEGRATHHYSQRWPLAPDLGIRYRSPSGLVLGGNESEEGVLIALAASHDVDVAEYRGCETPILGWWSDRLESMVPSVLAAADVVASDTVEIAALLVPYRGPTAPQAAVALRSNGATSVAEVSSGDGTRTVVEVAWEPPGVTVARSAAAHTTAVPGPCGEGGR